MTNPSPDNWSDPTAVTPQSSAPQPQSAPPLDPTLIAPQHSYTPGQASIPAPPADPEPSSPAPADQAAYSPAGPEAYAPVSKEAHAPADPYSGAPAPANPYSAAPAPGFDPYQAAGYPPGAPGYPPGGYGYGYPPAPRTNSLAIASLILSLVGIASCITAPIGAILGHIAQKQIRETGEGGEGFAKAGIIVGWIITAFMVLVILLYVVLIIFAIVGSTTAVGTAP
ncbi:DUF4190 domain-containing protein [Micromonospora sp. SH-82]|uniref:DUF4190 domain-containing protein n=1 Tax=Micromonospora sp. SH-82 TaxID=3132938 RepID=UPI003EBDAB3F